VRRVLVGRQSRKAKTQHSTRCGHWPKWGRQGQIFCPPRGGRRTLRTEAGDEELPRNPARGGQGHMVRSTRPAWGAFDLVTGGSGGMPPSGGGPRKAFRVKSSTMIAARKGLPVSLSRDGAKQRTLTTEGYQGACPFYLGKTPCIYIVMYSAVTMTGRTTRTYGGRPRGNTR
jgi:hypothetical protein